MTDISTRTPCSDRSARERLLLIGTKSTADFRCADLRSSGPAANVLQIRRIRGCVRTSGTCPSLHDRNRNYASINRKALAPREPSIHGPSDNGGAYAPPRDLRTAGKGAVFLRLQAQRQRGDQGQKIAHQLTWPVERPSQSAVKRVFDDFQYQAHSWDKPRRFIAKIEWHPGGLFPRVGFIVTNLPMEPHLAVRFYNQRGTAEQYIKEGKYAFRWTRLSCRKFRDNEMPAATARAGLQPG